MLVLSNGKASATRFQIALRRSFGIGCVMLFGLTLMAGAQRNSGSVRPASGSRDPRDILQETIRVYQGMSSYEGQSNVDTLLLNKSGEVIRQVGSTAKIRFKRPNKLALEFATPGGSRSIWSDGSLLIVYDALPKKYTVGPTAPNLTSMLPLLFQRAAVSASLDPLYCLSQKTLPKELTNLAIKETTVYNGHPVYVITGTLNGVDLTSTTGHTVNMQASAWTWWIDKNTYLIQKIETRTQNGIRPLASKIGQREQIINATATLIMRHTITFSKPNSAIPDSAFIFKAPPDATQRKDPGQR